MRDEDLLALMKEEIKDDPDSEENDEQSAVLSDIPRADTNSQIMK